MLVCFFFLFRSFLLTSFWAGNLLSSKNILQVGDVKWRIRGSPHKHSKVYIESTKRRVIFLSIVTLLTLQWRRMWRRYRPERQEIKFLLRIPSIESRRRRAPHPVVLNPRTTFLRRLDHLSSISCIGIRKFSLSVSERGPASLFYVYNR